MQSYVVGGALRDELLGLPVQDRDHVVVGATPEQMVAAGFRPVGRDFPVFLHPRSHEEYALARTERKIGRGYAGFSFHAAPDVSLEEDLRRRDLTINAMARGDDGVLVDPYGGRRDLEARVFRHVSEAFAEDPVRILRVARFAARFTDFTVAPETLALMRAMTAAGEVDALVAERVWQELSRGLMEIGPSRMITQLEACGALERLLPALSGIWSAKPPLGSAAEVDAVAPGPALRAQALAAVDAAAAAGCALAVRFAVLVWPIGPGLPALCEQLRVPVAVRDIAVLLAGMGPALAALDAGLAQGTPGSAATLLGLIERSDGLRKPARLDQCLEAAALITAVGPDGTGHASAVRPEDLLTWPPARALLDARVAALAVDAGLIARDGPAQGIRERVQAARIRAIDAAGSRLTPVAPAEPRGPGDPGRP